ncbi:MAG: ribose-phosphate pyrophosphokinase [Candidatus Competibacterales bacterium]
MMVFTGNAHLQLSESIVQHLNLPMGSALVSRFSDGEVRVEIHDNVRGRDVFVVQPTCSPPNDNLMELLIITDALRRSSAVRITAVMPYFGYSRQDRRPRSARVPISAKVVANMITTVGVDRVLTVDLHADQIQGFLDIPVDNIYATPIILEDIDAHALSQLVVVSPDVGGVLRARALAKRLEGAELAIIDKRRSVANQSEAMNLIGNVDGRHCIIIDDMVDTAGTLCQAAALLKANGAAAVYGYATHAVLSGPAIDNIEGSQLDQLVVTDTIPLGERAKACSRIRQLSVAGLLAETMWRIHMEESVSTLFT